MDGLIYTGPIPWEYEERMEPQSDKCLTCQDKHCPQLSKEEYVNCPVLVDEAAATTEEGRGEG